MSPGHGRPNRPGPSRPRSPRTRSSMRGMSHPTTTIRRRVLASLAAAVTLTVGMSSTATTAAATENPTDTFDLPGGFHDTRALPTQGAAGDLLRTEPAGLPLAI